MADPPAHPPPASHGFGATAAGAGCGLLIVEFKIIMLPPDVGAHAAGAGGGLLFVELEIIMLPPDIMPLPDVDAPDGLRVGDAKDRVFMPPPGSIATALPRLSGSSQRLAVLVR